MQETCERILEYETSRHGMKERVKSFIHLHDLYFVQLNSCLFHDSKQSFIVVCRFSDSECLVRTFGFHGRKVSLRNTWHPVANHS